MASGDRKRPAKPNLKRNHPLKGEKCPPRFVAPARTQPSLPSVPRAGYHDELEKDSKLLRAAKNFYPEGELKPIPTRLMRGKSLPSLLYTKIQLEEFNLLRQGFVRMFDCTVEENDILFAHGSKKLHENLPVGVLLSKLS